MPRRIHQQCFLLRPTNGVEVEPRVHSALRRPVDAETVIAPRAWTMAAFADAECYLLEVRLTDARDVIAEGLVRGE